MANRLQHAQSPYLQQHAENPVDWQEWDEAAFAQARAENKPIFLSIGYSTCHWCHVMAHESFEDEDIAALLNADFIAIKVDREERPDVDQVYMTYVQALTGHGGWPLSVWLTPDRKPFYGGTYFPPADRGGRAGFPSLLRAIAGAWKDPAQRAQLIAEGDRVIAALQP
ncbi:MAG: thioredoxin domain-containing protein, partial [Opitutaceae bacterium]